MDRYEKHRSTDILPILLLASKCQQQTPLFTSSPSVLHVRSSCSIRQISNVSFRLPMAGKDLERYPRYCYLSIVMTEQLAAKIETVIIEIRLLGRCSVIGIMPHAVTKTPLSCSFMQVIIRVSRKYSIFPCLPQSEEVEEHSLIPFSHRCMN